MKRKEKKIGFFFDRDGTLIVDKNYLRDPEGVELIPGVVEGLRLLQPHGPLVVVTNQSGVARGSMTAEDVEAVNTRVDELLQKEGIQLAAQYYAPHHPDFGVTPAGKENWRKPGTGMVDAAATELGIDPRRSYVVGDRRADLELGRNAGAVPILVLTGYELSEEKKESLSRIAAMTANNMKEAAEWILADLKNKAEGNSR